jgi:transcriptional regulator with XRE-family HTH domain
MTSKYYQNYILIGLAIGEVRKSKGLSQEELAVKIGVSKSYLSKIEAPNCKKSFSLEVLFDIANALNTPIEHFFKTI